MWKVILVSIFCLLAAGVVLALKSIGQDKAAELAAAMPFSVSNSHSINERTETFAVNSAAKADKLFVALSEDDPTKVAFDRVQLLPVQTDSKTATKAPITSWHWNASSNKITRK
jgi:hypothetical protein